MDNIYNLMTPGANSCSSRLQNRPEQGGISPFNSNNREHMSVFFQQIKGFLNNPLGKAYDRFIRIRGNPREIGLGFALGLFLGFTPTMGIQLALAVFFASLLKWNKYAAAIGVWITNPVTAPFIYGFTYFAGSRLTGLNNSYNLNLEFNWNTLIDLLTNSPGLIVSLFVGGLVVGLPVAAMGYLLAHGAVVKYRKDLKQKLKLKKDKLKNRVQRKKKRLQDGRSKNKLNVRKLSDKKRDHDDHVIDISSINTLKKKEARKIHVPPPDA